MSLIQNERTKLLASALNTAATSSFAIGVIAPMAAVFYNVNQPPPILALLLGIVLWFTAAIGLHLAARYILGRLLDE